MDFHRHQKFSTYDRDNDELSRGSCAISHKGGWWYTYCYEVNFNGQYGDPWDTGICMHNRKEAGTVRCDISKTKMEIKPVGELVEKSTTTSPLGGKWFLW